MKAENSLKSRVDELEKKVYNLGKSKSNKLNDGKTIITSILILEKAWRFLLSLLSELDL